ncbi:hypothetical protein, partial [Candidatus Frankia alpina]|uniref:hypothetical protein n=1 Tax=Candidatus Frankia alpina TaxID=2699483 RepID=UPI0013D41E8C
SARPSPPTFSPTPSSVATSLTRENAELHRVISLLRTTVPLVTTRTGASLPGDRPGGERHGSPRRRAAQAKHPGPAGGGAATAAT